jgi:hypothetical protein
MTGLKIFRIVTWGLVVIVAAGLLVFGDILPSRRQEAGECQEFRVRACG